MKRGGKKREGRPQSFEEMRLEEKGGGGRKKEPVAEVALFDLTDFFSP